MGGGRQKSLIVDAWDRVCQGGGRNNNHNDNSDTLLICQVLC